MYSAYTAAAVFSSLRAPPAYEAEPTSEGLLQVMDKNNNMAHGKEITAKGRCPQLVRHTQCSCSTFIQQPDGQAWYDCGSNAGTPLHPSGTRRDPESMRGRSVGVLSQERPLGCDPSSTFAIDHSVLRIKRPASECIREHEHETRRLQHASRIRISQSCAPE